MNHLVNIKTITTHRFFRFLATGGLNTIFGYTAYAALLFVNVPYLTALFIATVAGVIFNYFSLGRLVFHDMGGKFVFIKFIITYLIVYISNAVLLDLLTKKFIISPYIGQVICIPFGVIVSWILMNKWVYKKGSI
jgi:putative flippase GtrA